MPEISVVIPSFNHVKYLRECIQSVLDQDYQDFEIIITDDESTDGSVEVIKEFKDERIHLYSHGKNKGACVTLNHCIEKSSGEFVAVLNSDDAWQPTKLGKQLAYLNNHPETAAVFSKVRFVDEDSQLLSPEDYKYFYVFEQHNRSRYAWLNQFFFRGNCLCHPSILIRKKCYDQIGLYDERMANVPDLDMWVRLCLRYEIHILDETLVRFRIMKNEANASGDNLTTHIRARFEYKHILSHFLTIKDKESFLKIFPEAAKYGEVGIEYIPYFLGMLALEVPGSTSQLWGLDVLYDILGNRNTAEGLAEKYKFRYLDFHKLTAQRDVFNITPMITAKQNAQIELSALGGGKRNLLLRFAIRVHLRLATMARKYILK